MPNPDHGSAETGDFAICGGLTPLLIRYEIVNVQPRLAGGFAAVCSWVVPGI